MDAPNANLAVAVLSGMLSFISPCVLPLVPAYLGYMSGATVQRGALQAARATILVHALAFVLGFTLIFVMIFGIGVDLLRDLFGPAYRSLIQWIGGSLLIVFGLHFLGVFNLPWLDTTRKLDIRPSQRLGYFRSFLIGLGFAAGWTPCVGPFLGLLLGMSGNVAAVPLFVAYSLGLGIPFVLTALSMGQLSLWLRKITQRSFDLRVAGRTLVRNLNVVSMVSGLLMIFMGALLLSNRVTMLNGWIAPLLPTWLQGV